MEDVRQMQRSSRRVFVIRPRDIHRDEIVSRRGITVGRFGRVALCTITEIPMHGRVFDIGVRAESDGLQIAVLVVIIHLAARLTVHYDQSGERRDCLTHVIGVTLAVADAVNVR